METISKEDLLSLLRYGSPVLIDLRLNWTSDTVKIKTAIHEEADDVGIWASTYDREDTIILYCSSPAEKTSRKVALELEKKGFTDVRVLRGGWAMWASSGLSTQRKNRAPSPKGVISDVLSD